MKEGKFEEIINYCYPNTELYNETSNQIKNYKNNKDEANSFLEEIRSSNFYIIENVLKLNNEQGILVIELKKIYQ
jgi:hypothetical protein